MDNKVWYNWDGKKEQTENTTEQEKPYESIHARQICEMIGESPREIDKWIDAVVQDSTVLRALFGEKEYLKIKEKLTLSKTTLDVEDSSSLLKTPEFKSIFEKLRNEKLAQKQYQEDKIQEEKLRDKLHEIELPDELQEKKERIEQCKEIVKKLNSRKDTKDLISYGRSYNDMLKYFKNKQDNIVNAEDAKVIYDFIFDYIESNYNKKKRKKGELSADFFTRNWDYLFNWFMKHLNEEEIKFKKEETKFRERNRTKISKTALREIKNNLLSPNIDEKEIQKEALQKLRDDIKHWKIDSIQERFYLEKDMEDMERINRIVRNRVKTILATIDFDDIELNLQQGKDEIIQWKHISAHKDHYYEIKNRIKTYAKWTDNQKEENIRWFIFDRLIEFVWIAITKQRIDEIISQKAQYKWTTYRIMKTDFLDDSYWWADFIVLFKFSDKTNKKEEIAVIDLLTSRTKFKNDFFDEQDPVKEQKILKAKEPKFLYSSYIDLLKDSRFKMFKLKALKRIVIEEDAKMTYHFLADFMKWKTQDLWWHIDKFFAEKWVGKLQKVDPSSQQLSRVLDWDYEDIETAA